MMRRATLAMCLVAAGSLWGQARLPGDSTETGANLPPRPIGAGDLLSISVYGAPEMSRTARVSQEGSIRLPILRSRSKHAERSQRNSNSAWRRP